MSDEMFLDEEDEESERCREIVRNIIRKEAIITVPSKRTYKQVKTLKKGKIGTYYRTDYYIRLPSSANISAQKPAILTTWEGLERLMNAKEMCYISDSAFSFIFAEIVGAFY